MKRRKYKTEHQVKEVKISRTLYSIHHCQKRKFMFVNSLASARIRGFSGKKRLNTHGFAWEYLRSGMLYWPSKSLRRHGKSSSLHSKKYFLLGGLRVFLWVTS